MDPSGRQEGTVIGGQDDATDDSAQLLRSRRAFELFARPGFVERALFHHRRDECEALAAQPSCVSALNGARLRTPSFLPAPGRAASVKS